MTPTLRNMIENSPRWLFTAAALCFLSGPAVADKWHRSVSLPVSIDYDSNSTLSSTGKTALWITRAVPNLSLTGTYGSDEIKAGLALQIEEPSDKRIAMSRQDPSVSLDWRRQTQTGEFGVAAKYDEASTRVSELQESGLVVRDGTRTTSLIAGSWRSTVTERSSLTADVEHKAVAYGSGTLTGFSNSTLGMTYGYAWSERIEPFLRVSSSHYAPDSVAVASSDNQALTGGVKLKVSEQLEWTGQAGTSKVSGQTESTGWQGSFVLRYTGTQSDLSIDAGRAISPSGEGGFVKANQIKGAWGHAIDERTRAGLDASWRDSKGNTPNTMNQLGAWASRELSPFWNARLSYQHKQRQQSGQADASANLLGVTLIYVHPDF